MGPVPADYHGSMTDYAALKKAGAPILGWGEFLTQVVSFLILAFIIFLMVRWATKLMRKPEVVETVAPTEVELLAEIRDELSGARLQPFVRTRRAVRHASEFLETRVVAQRIEVGIQPKILDHRRRNPVDEARKQIDRRFMSLR